MIPVAVVIPTYKRPEKLAACIRSIQAQTATPYHMKAEEDVAGEYAIGIWNRFAPDTPDGFSFVYLCDDVELDPTCLETAWKTLTARFPDGDGVVGFNQRNISGKDGTSRSAMGMIGGKFLDRFPGRRPFCPDYERFHFDSELGLYAQSVGKFVFESKATLVHWHPFHYPERKDEAHERVRESWPVMLDGLVWKERRRRGLVWGKTETLIREEVASR